MRRIGHRCYRMILFSILCVFLVGCSELRGDEERGKEERGNSAISQDTVIQPRLVSGVHEANASWYHQLEIRNQTSEEFVDLRVSANEDIEWGPNLMVKGTCRPGESVTVPFELSSDTGIWDLKIVGSDGGELIWEDLPLQGLSHLTLLMEDSIPVAEWKEVQVLSLLGFREQKGDDRMVRTPLYDALARHQDWGRAVFHMPGHRNRQAEYFQSLFSLDLTELPDTDSLYQASGPIREAEQCAKEYFSTKGTFFSAGGCTLCVQAMLRLCAPRGGRLLCGRVIHERAVQAMSLLDIEPVWVYPRLSEDERYWGRIHPEDVRRLLEVEKEIVGVFITSPDYFGVLSDISGISEVCTSFGIPLIVDAAHGAHLLCVDRSLNVLAQGAAMVSCSAHKTLPALTGAAFLHIQDERFLPEAKEAMTLFGSTSPSYLIMASLDLCRAWMEERGKPGFSQLIDRLEPIKKKAMERALLSPGGLSDPTRLSFYTLDAGYTGEQLANYLRGRGVEPEFADREHVVLIPTPFNEEWEFARLSEALGDLPQKRRLDRGKGRVLKPKKECTLREALFARTEKIGVYDAVGRVAAHFENPCPPGIPLLIPGEMIDAEMKEFLLECGIFEVSVLQ